MCRIFAVLFLGLALIGASEAWAKNETLDDLRAWIGKYPADQIDGHKLWDNPELQKKMAAFAGPNIRKILFEGGLSVSSPVAIQDDVLYLSSCQEHACAVNQAKVFVDLKKKAVFLCWRYAYREMRDVWLEANQDPQFLSPGSCTEEASDRPFDLLKKYRKG
ncbi:MAG: hypothetical protein AB7E52_04640 [Bdellovibrionales bacterium]